VNSYSANAIRSLVLVVAGTSSCATEYTPRESHHISFVEAGGAFKLTRDSQTFGIFDVDRAVAGNPKAESEARTYVHRTTAGLVADIVGVGLLGTGIGVGGRTVSSTRRDVGEGLVLGGVLSITAAAILVMTGLPHFYDAVNIYNDSLPPEPSR